MMIEGTVQVETVLVNLEEWATKKATLSAFTFLNARGEEIDQLSFKALRNRSLAVAKALEIQFQRGSRILLFFRSGLEFITAFLGCLYADMIAVPISPPQGKRQQVRMKAVFEDALPNGILATQVIREQMKKQAMSDDLLFHLPWLDIESIDYRETLSNFSIERTQDVAFLQYTSGSTSQPKGVMISHKNLFYNEQAIAKAFAHNPESKVVGWLPFYHDMGLIGNILHPIFMGIPCVLMSPTTFLQNPLVWLETISKYQATTSGGPDFAYQLCCHKIVNPPKDLDLSTWKIAFNGSEVVHPQTVEEFSRKFAENGFSVNAFYPCYGLAETTLFATGIQAGTPLRIVQKVVSCGVASENHEVRIVDPSSKETCHEGTTGEVWLRGPSVAEGYWNLPTETKKTFQAFTKCGEGPFLRTGDLGFIDKSELFLCGRIKNSMIFHGKNYYPQDIEYAIQKGHVAFSGKQGAAFSILKQTDEVLVVVQEVERSSIKYYGADALIKCIKKIITEEFFLEAYSILLVPLGSIPKTTSGKVQHHQCKDTYLEGQITSFLTWTRELEASKLTDSSPPSKTQNELENQLLTYIAGLFSVSREEIHLEEPLLNYGLSSLKAVTLAGWIKNSFDVELEIEQIFEGLSVSKLACLISERAADSINKEEKIRKEPFCGQSQNQENLWVFQQLNPESAAYNIPIVLKASGRLNLEALRQAFTCLLTRHEALRTVFEMKEGKPLQKILSSATVAITHKTVTEGQIDEEIQKEAFLPFDLSVGPLVRMTVYTISEKTSFILLTFHHIICDGWSMTIFAQELQLAYQNKLDTQNLSQACSYSEWVREEQEKDHSAKEVFWKEYLKGDLPVLTLGPFHKHPRSSRDIGGRRDFYLSDSLLNKLGEFAKREQSTTAMSLFTAFHLLLHLYSNQEVILVGYPSANRQSFDFQNTFGYFVNTLVSKTNFTKDSTLKEILKQVRESVLKGIQNEAVSFQTILKLSNPPRIEGVSPLFQAMFVVQNGPSALTGFPDLHLEIISPQVLPVIYDLVLEISEKKNGIKLSFEYKKDCLPDFLVDQMVTHYLDLLNCLLENSDQQIKELEIFVNEKPPKHRQEVDFKEAYDSVIALVEQQVQLKPNQIAVISSDRKMTYGELDTYANGLAQLLLQKGLEQNELVGFCLERCPEQIATMLGIAKAGGVYVPLDANYPRERLKAMLEDTQMRFLVVSENLLEAFSSFKKEIIDPFQKFTCTVKPTRQPSLAYTLYTSGSSGRPKGVVVDHKALLHFTLSAIKLFQMTAQDRVLQFASISWDTSSEEIYPCLASGGILVLRDNSVVEPFEELLAKSQLSEITIWNLPTSYWQDLTDYLITKQKILPPSLRLVIVGGEAISRTKVVAWFQHFGKSVKLLNTYGTTEATSISTAFDLSEWSDSYPNAPIGKAIDRVETFILNAHGKRVPRGVLGQLNIGGAGLAKGYRNLPELTSQKFILHQNYGRLYQTGDFCYEAEDGTILLQGRSDSQVKRRGFRIDLEEIQAVLNQLPFVKKSLVLNSKELEGQNSFLSAYIVLQEDERPDRSLIKNRLSQKIPPYMMPDDFVFLKEFPHLPNGKINSAALAAHTFIVQEDTPKQAEALSQTEIRLINIWKDLLKIDEIEKMRSFFDVGGNSLLVIQLHQQICDQFSIQLPIADLFTHHTLTAQAEMLDRAAGSRNLSPLELLKNLEEGKIDVDTAKALLTKRKK